MFTNIKLYMFFCLCEVIAESSTPINWDMKSKSVIFGEDTSLTCNGHTCSPHSKKQWIGGPSYDLLCSEDFTTNPYKYAMVLQSTSSYFDLMIRNFTFDDAYCSYTCICGLHQYTKVLDLDSLEFIYPPLLEKDFRVTKESPFQMELLMKVYPLPTCKTLYQENIIPVNITDYTTTYYHDGHLKLYAVRIEHKYAMDHLSCKGCLKLICTVGSRNYTVIEKTINLCSEDQNDLTNIVIVSVLVCVLVVTCIACIWCARRFVKRKTRRKYVAKHTKHKSWRKKETTKKRYG